MSLVAALMLATATGAVPAPVALGSVCIDGDPVAANLLARRLAERGAVAKDCAVRVRMRSTRAMPPEAFRIEKQGDGVTISAKGRRGLIYGAGWILRHTDGLRLTLDTPLTRSPRQVVRGTQIGYRPKNNSYDAWTPAMLKRRIEDFALWGRTVSRSSRPGPTMPRHRR